MDFLEFDITLILKAWKSSIDSKTYINICALLQSKEIPQKANVIKKIHDFPHQPLV
jgi:hypothetical protein